MDFSPSAELCLVTRAQGRKSPFCCLLWIKTSKNRTAELAGVEHQTWTFLPHLNNRRKIYYYTVLLKVTNFVGQPFNPKCLTTSVPLPVINDPRSQKMKSKCQQKTLLCSRDLFIDAPGSPE